MIVTSRHGRPAMNNRLVRVACSLWALKVALSGWQCLNAVEALVFAKAMAGCQVYREACWMTAQSAECEERQVLLEAT